MTTAPEGPAPRTAGRRTHRIGGSLTRYRVMAYIVGVWLTGLCLVGLPLEYIGGYHQVGFAWTVHGLLFILYVLAAFELTVMRLRWSLLRSVGVLLAGTIPFLSFVVERRVTARVRANEEI